MFKKMVSIIPVALLSVTVGANVQAATITVQKGDTLWDLSRANNTTVETIQKLNHLNTDLIHPGDVLTIAQEKQYIVEQGDTLWDIARDHHVRVSQIKEWNQLHTYLIHPNLSLAIYEGVEANNAAIPEKSVKPAAQERKESTSEAAAPSKSTAEPKESAPVATAPSTSTSAPKESTPIAAAPTTKAAASKEIIVEATAYTASCEGCSGITSTGINLLENPDAKVISVDPSVIPLGSKVYVEGYGEAIAGDTGGAIKGNKIDVFIPSKEDAINFGRKQLKVTILE